MNRPNARTTDPITSHLAGDKALSFAVRHRSVIYACLLEHGPMGKDGIAKRTGMTGVMVARRLPEMLDCVRTTGRRVPSDTGNLEREWEAV